MTFRNAELADLHEMQTLYVEAIESICCEDYDDAQRKEWAATAQNKQRWLDVLESQFVLLAIIDQKIAGFATLKDGEYLDFFYVHKDFQKRGIAKKLLQKMEQKAIELKSDVIWSDISITAKPFFEKNDFLVIAKQSHTRNDVILINFRMRKQLMQDY